jgi:hypothetical protein
MAVQTSSFGQSWLMAKKQRFGICRVCRTPNVKLTFEHVPPRSSFNDIPAETFGLMDYLKTEDHDLTGGRIAQRGSGEWSLCKQCNEKTGTWYVRELGRATRAAARVLNQLPLDELDGNPEQEVVRVKFTGVGRRPRPLLLVKQMITMLLAISPAELSLANPELGDFVLDRECSGLSDRYQLYLALFAGPLARTVGGSSRINVFTGQVDVFSEIAYPPFAYVLTIDSPPGALRVGNVSPFAALKPQQEADIEIDLIVGFGHTLDFLNYQSKASVERNRARNAEFE